MANRTAYELLQEVRKHNTGARELFVVARLSLKTGLDLNALRPDDRDEAKAKKLQNAVREVCPNIPL